MPKGKNIPQLLQATCLSGWPRKAQRPKTSKTTMTQFPISIQLCRSSPQIPELLPSTSIFMRRAKHVKAHAEGTKKNCLHACGSNSSLVRCDQVGDTAQYARGGTRRLAALPPGKFFLFWLKQHALGFVVTCWGLPPPACPLPGVGVTKADKMA